MKSLILKMSLWLSVTACCLRAADFPVPYNSEPDPSRPLPPSEAAATLKLPPGFQAAVFAAEPDVQNPIGMSWDTRGRLWVAENYTYAERALKFDLRLRDRILIFDDPDDDGRFDRRKVFSDTVQMLTSVEVGHGGVWAMCPPQLLFIPDRNRDDVPDSAPEVVLDGFTIPPENYHNFANGLRFGPDGWLYGRCGASSPGEIGAPGAPANERIPMRGTMWRYHPQQKIFEALSCGTTNPWGHDWDEHGELFFINTVNGHLWHGFAGAHFVRPHTIDPNPRVFTMIDQHADHWHFDTAVGWAKSRDNKADAYGGGHAHIGMMIYLGDNWPAEYRGRLFTLNMHGRRANQEILERRGSGYVGRHGSDFFLASDPWFRAMELSYGPDGGVFVLDWSDAGECHESTGVHRTSGRIYKITYGEAKRRELGDLARLGSSELVALHTHPNEWFSRQARLELAGRVADGRGLGSTSNQLLELFEKHTDVVVKLRALWTLHAIGAADQKFLLAQLQHSNEHVRTWAIRLLSDRWPLDTVMSQRPANAMDTPDAKRLASPDGNQNQSLLTSAATMERMVQAGRTDTSGLVRLALASTLQRLPVSRRVELAAALVARKEDADDHNLPLLIWYGLIPVADAAPAALATLAGSCELPFTRKFMARRLSEEIEKNPGPLDELLRLAAAKPESFQADILNGMAEGLTGWRKARKPGAWDALAKKLEEARDASLRDRVRDLSVLFGDGRALDEVKKVALDKNADLNARKAALQTLIDSRAPDLRQLCEQFLNVRFLNSIAARGLAIFDDPAISTKLVKAYREFHPSERGQLLATLVSRPTFANALLSAVAEGKIPRAEISAFHARQIRSLNDADLNKKLAAAWGELRDSTADKQELIAKWKSQLRPATLSKADRSQGRAVFNLACAPCHTLYGEGGKVGPDLTGGGRDNLDYLLENLIDPSAVVTADFRMSVLSLKDGRVLNGLIAAKTDRTLTLKTSTETLTVERGEIESTQESTLSLMPEGVLEGLAPEQGRDLIAYLMQRSQAPLPAQESRQRPMELEDLFRIKRVGDPQISPDGKWVAYVITEVDKEENRTNSDIWLVPAEGGEPRPLTNSPKQDRHPRWSPDGKWIAFESNRNGKFQVYLIRVDGGEARELTSISTEAQQAIWSPDGKQIGFVSAVFPEFSNQPFKESDAANKKKEEEREKSKVKARVITKLLYRHWDSWVDDKRQHIFVVPVKEGAAAGDPRDVTPGDRDAVPTSTTFSAGDEFDFSPDGREIAYTATPIPAREEAWNTNHDLYVVNLETGERRQIITNPAADGLPRYSPDGKHLAYRAQSRAGFEADRWQLMLYERATGQTRSLTPEFDSWVEGFVWLPDSKKLFFEAEEKGTKPIWSVSVDGGPVKKLVGQAVNGDLALSSRGQGLVFSRQTLSRPVEICKVDLGTSTTPVAGEGIRRLTHVNDELFSKIVMAEPESVWFEGSAGAQVQMWIIKPPHFESGKKYPLVFWVHGGPQGAFMDSWSYRWNAQLWAAQGYVLALPNPRGSTGFGQKFVDEISHDWGGKVFADLMSGLAYMEKQPYIDTNRMAAAGASYGGYMMSWFQGHTDKFKTLVTHCGVYNFWNMYGATEEIWFDEWEHGIPWEMPDFDKFSPHRLAQNFKTPNLIIHNELDFRVPVTEGFSLFTTLQRKGIPSKLLYFPDEGHWVLKPQNSELWHKTVLEWLSEYLK